MSPMRTQLLDQIARLEALERLETRPAEWQAIGERIAALKLKLDRLPPERHPITR